MTEKIPLHRAKIIARKASKALAGESPADIAPALAMMTVGMLQQNFDAIGPARELLTVIQDFERDFLNDAFPGGVPPTEARAPADPAVQEAQAQIDEHIHDAQQLAARIEAAALRDVDIAVQMYAISFLAAHLAAKRSATIAMAYQTVDAIFGTAKSSIASNWQAKQHGMTKQ